MNTFCRSSCGSLFSILALVALPTKAAVVDLTAEARAVGTSAYEAYSSTTQGNYNARKAFDGDYKTNAGNQ